MNDFTYTTNNECVEHCPTGYGGVIINRDETEE